MFLLSYLKSVLNFPLLLFVFPIYVHFVYSYFFFTCLKSLYSLMCFYYFHLFLYLFICLFLSSYSSTFFLLAFKVCIHHFSFICLSLYSHSSFFPPIQNLYSSLFLYLSTFKQSLYSSSFTHHSPTFQCCCCLC